MERANQALRRSSVKLKSLNSGHGDLNMIISDVKEVRSAFKNFHLAQVTTWEDMSKWANKEKNIALQETLHILLDLFYLWSEVQLDFVAGLKKFRQQFEKVLESEHILDKSKTHLSTCEQRESKLRKELKKVTAKGNVEDAKQLSERQVETQALVKVAQTEVQSKTLENEAVKLLLVKDGLLNISSCYLELAEKAAIIFQAHKEVTKSIPDVHDRDIEEIRYSGSEVARNIVHKTKEIIHHYKKSSVIETAPPPYTTSPQVFQRPMGVPEYSLDSSGSFIVYSPELTRIHETYEPTNHFRHPEYPPQYDLPPVENVESLEGAVGGLNLSGTDNSRRYANM